jgi:hypothetical protein
MINVSWPVDGFLEANRGQIGNKIWLSSSEEIGVETEIPSGELIEFALLPSDREAETYFEETQSIHH